MEERSTAAYPFSNSVNGRARKNITSIELDETRIMRQNRRIISQSVQHTAFVKCRK